MKHQLLSPAAQPCPAHWVVDQQSLTQGLTPDEAQRLQALVARGEALWQTVQEVARQQPVVELCNALSCAAIQTAADRLRAVAETLVVVGTGGASLGAQTLCAFAEQPTRVVYLDNCDATSVSRIFATHDPLRTAWVLISKSGETVETLAASLAVIAHHATLGVDLRPRVLTITSPGARPLRLLAESQGWEIMDHPPELGGRFSVFSCVGLLPAAFAGMDIAALGALVHQSWHHLLDTKDADLLEAAAWFAATLETHPLHVLMAYSDRLRPYTQWYKQLWAESLGKNGRGPTPVTATGSIDQHSQLQLYLDGAKDKLFTLILPAEPTSHLLLASIAIPGVSYLGGHGMEQVMQASAEATFETIRAKHLPLRVLRSSFSITTVCQLMVRTMLETLLVAAMLEVDPYSQPAVEEGKHRARKRLGL